MLILKVCRDTNGGKRYTSKCTLPCQTKGGVKMTIKEQILKLITEGKIKRNSYRYIANQIYEIVKDEYENGYQKGYKDAEIGITRSDEEVYDKGGLNGSK
jgi:hypothetical protein